MPFSDEFGATLAEVSVVELAGQPNDETLAIVVLVCWTIQAANYIFIPLSAIKNGDGFKFQKVAPLEKVIPGQTDIFVVPN